MRYCGGDNNTFDVSNYSGTATIDGGSTIGNTITASESGPFTLTDTQLTTPSATITLSNVEVANLTDTDTTVSSGGGFVLRAFGTNESAEEP